MVEIAKGVTIKIARRAVAEIIRDQAEARAAAPEGPARGKNAPAEIEAADEAVDETADETADVPTKPPTEATRRREVTELFRDWRPRGLVRAYAHVVGT